MNNRRKTVTVRSAGVAVVMTVLGAASAARGDVYMIYEGPESFAYEADHVPDLDQQRALLPNQGVMYCVPTASINWMAYFANHGADWIAPGPGNWQSDALYNAATNAIYNMGELMGTDEEEGTTGNGGQFALLAWTASKVAVVHEYTADDWAVTYDEVAAHAMNGAYVMPTIGWYNGEPPCIVRDGGHLTTLTTIHRQPGERTIGWRDPGSDEGPGFTQLVSQSQFTNEYYLTSQHLVAPGCDPGLIIMSRVDGYNNNTGYIDAVFALYPIFALTTSEEGTALQYINPQVITGSNISHDDLFNTALNTAAIDVALHSDLASALYLAEGEFAGDPTQLWELDPITGESQQINVDFSDPSALMVSRRRDVYVLDGDEVVCIDIDGPKPEVVAIVTPPSPPSALMYDDEADEVVLLSVDDRVLMRYPWHLDAPPNINAVPDEIPLAGQAHVAWNPANGGTWMMSEATTSLYQITVDPATGQQIVVEVQSPELNQPEDLAVGDGGRVYVADQGTIVEFVDDGAGGWIVAPDPNFEGFEVGGFVQVARSRTNYDETLHSGPEWNNVLPETFGESIPDCTADLDFDGSVGVGDLLALLAAWGPCNGTCYEDIDADLAVGVGDLLELLSAWGDCP